MTEVRYFAPYELKKSHMSDSCFSLRAWGINGGKIRLDKGETAKIGTGVKFHIPEGYQVQVVGKQSFQGEGLFQCEGLLVHTGTVDSKYMGEVKVIVTNLSVYPFFIEDGMRIAKAFICEVPEVSLKREEEEESEKFHYILAEVPESLLKELKTEARVSGKRFDEFCGFLLEEGLKERRGERGDHGFGSTGKYV